MKDQRSSRARTENYNFVFVHDFPDNRSTSRTCKYDNPNPGEAINRKRRNESYLHSHENGGREFSGAFDSRRDFSLQSEFSTTDFPAG